MQARRSTPASSAPPEIARGTSTDGAARALFGVPARLGVVVPRLFGPDECARACEAVHRARDAWNHDFGGAQFSLGRAFYTHLETSLAAEYFARAADSDACVERVLPGMQARMRDLVADLTGGHARARRGWCSAGVHVFPAGGEVASRGGVRHFDVEGLTERHLAENRRAVSVVIMLDVPEGGGGLRLWDARYHGREHPTRKDERAKSVVLAYGVGDLIAFDSHRLHQILPFSGARDRVSITLHAAELDPGVWETWF